jgi:hypothetical protein
MHKTCDKCRANFEITRDDQAFYDRFGVVVPKLCPVCRAELRLSFRNERVFYKRACDKCHKDVVSMYSPNKPYTVWCYDCWFADDWDATEYAREYDSEKPFLTQYEELWKAVPKIALIYVKSPGSEYTNISADNKNCYFIIESSNNEDSIHSYWIQECRDVVDTSFASKCELCYECDDCYNSYKLLYSKGCHDCRGSSFLLDCKGVSDSLGCVNLRQQQYCIFNKQYSKEDYFEKLKSYRLDTASGIEAFQKEFTPFVLAQPRKYTEIVNTMNSTGNYIKHAKNCLNCFHCYDAEDNKYGVHIWRNAKDTMDCDTAGRNAQMIYNSINSGLDTSNQIACAVCWSSTFAGYSMYCFNSNYIFGCAGLRKKDYCILNKQYSKEEYEILRSKIVEELTSQGDYGQFFPASFSCFGYNESAAFEQFPLEKEAAIAAGFKWEDTPRGTYGKETQKWENVADSISENADTDADMTKEIFACTNCSKNYRVIPNEFLFYKRLEIPLPRMCPDCRHARRFAARGPNALFERTCSNCNAAIQASYSPDHPEILYCESCYNQAFA